MKKLIVLLLIVVLMTSCTNGSAIENEELDELRVKLENVTGEIEELKKDVADMTKTIDKQKNTIDKLMNIDLKKITEKSDQMYNDLENESVRLSINSTGYVLLKNDYGTFPISFEDAEPYLNGFKITLRIGNMTNIRFSDVNVHFVFSEKYANMKLSEKLSDPGVSINIYNYFMFDKYITHQETKYFEPGSWTYINAVLPNTTLEELETMYLLLEFSNVYMRTN